MALPHWNFASHNIVYYYEEIIANLFYHHTWNRINKGTGILQVKNRLQTGDKSGPQNLRITHFFSIKALLSSLRTVETMAPAAGTASTDASMQADSAAGASTPSRLNLGVSFDITQSTEVFNPRLVQLNRLLVVIRKNESARPLPHSDPLRTQLECWMLALSKPARAQRSWRPAPLLQPSNKFTNTCMRRGAGFSTLEDVHRVTQVT